MFAPEAQKLIDTLSLVLQPGPLKSVPDKLKNK